MTHFFNKLRTGFLIAMSVFVLSGGVAKATSLEASEKLVTDFFRIMVAETSRLGDRDKRIERLTALIEQYGDGEVIAKQSLGVAGRRASPAQIEAYREAFIRYFVKKYHASFTDFGGYTLKIRSSRKIKSYARVEAYIENPQGERINLSVLVIERNGKTRFFNLTIEGVNLILNERAEITMLLDKRGGDLNRLIKDLPTLY